MPNWLQAIANVNPISYTIDAVRRLMVFSDGYGPLPLDFAYVGTFAVIVTSNLRGSLMEIPEQINIIAETTHEKDIEEQKLCTTLVEAIDLKKTYMLGKVPVEALRGVNLKVETGDFVSILGPSGSGKSTMLNLIGALDKPTSGTMLIDGVDISKLNDNQLADLRKRIGFVFQFFNLIPRLTAKDNVELSMSIADMNKTERRKRAIELLKP